VLQRVANEQQLLNFGVMENCINIFSRGFVYEVLEINLLEV